LLPHEETHKSTPAKTNKTLRVPRVSQRFISRLRRTPSSNVPSPIPRLRVSGNPVLRRIASMSPSADPSTWNGPPCAPHRAAPVSWKGVELLEGPRSRGTGFGERHGRTSDGRPTDVRACWRHEARAQTQPNLVALSLQGTRRLNDPDPLALAVSPALSLPWSGPDSGMVGRGRSREGLEQRTARAASVSASGFLRRRQPTGRASKGAMSSTGDGRCGCRPLHIFILQR
jgi:hypothetical protein